MERMLWANAMKARWVIGGGFGLSFVQQMYWNQQLRDVEVFGADGNGGSMLKIVTDLTDEEMARLKYVRRLYWHWRGSRKMYDGRDQISDQELSDRGIELPQEEYIEYVKRPPHDKYL
mmetsp:Transcript_3827/g.2550  ORF Transcript_3827/g.2550 Transcript_3827/m.2550 type:complete len:118 (-) Transcript_3827:136-489(-)|eukprot:CAMPEP_0116876092 /NCGR_PEP_ID=MMETSP0463-20121206/8127_1 /TAXON_ID=181622 /ORGANISM="Strombidinopsis sp, Strain SopsisLIS2011" /LENGTH=117 /DNA_ID=CAMNT_0004522537 /DNA_START=31 /DNA_END=384 /DNA_ORIENTATION=-